MLAQWKTHVTQLKIYFCTFHGLTHNVTEIFGSTLYTKFFCTSESHESDLFHLVSYNDIKLRFKKF